MVMESQRVPQRVGVDQHINRQLALKGYFPPNLRENAYGRYAALSTNEKMDPHLFDAIKRHDPDGYIVGVGCGMSLGLPLGFKTGNPPKGAVLVDVDRHVTALSNAFVNAVGQTRNIADFYNRFYSDPITYAKDFLAEDPESLKALQEMTPTKEDNLRGRVEASRGDLNKRVSPLGYPSMDNMLGATYTTWKQLVKEGKVAVVHGSLIDPQVIDAITSLPEYTNSKNLIYTSNIADHLVLKYSWEECDETLQPYLQAMARYNPREKPAIFLDTLRGFNYWLRSSEGPPHTSAADVRALGHYNYPEGFKLPHLHYEKQPKRFTPLDLSKIDDNQLQHMLDTGYESLFDRYPELERKELKQFVLEISDFIFLNGNVDPNYFGGIKPIDWVRFRLGEDIGHVAAVYLEQKGRKRIK